MHTCKYSHIQIYCVLTRGRFKIMFSVEKLQPRGREEGDSERGEVVIKDSTFTP